MDNREKEILEQLNDKIDDVKIPESLKPENIETQLSRHSGPKKSRRIYYALSAAAAACLLIIAGVTVFNRTANDNKSAVGQTGQLAVADSYDQIYEYLEELDQTSFWDGWLGRSSVDKAETSAAEESSESDTGADYSDTNVREEGVGESDYVKTDGAYIYAGSADMSRVEIVDTTGENMKKVGTIKLDGGLVLAEFYIQDEKLVVLCHASVNADTADDSSASFYDEYDSMAYYSAGNTKVLIYDISDPAKPKQIGEVNQSGRYHSSRVVGDYIYVFSRFYANSHSAKSDLSYYVPYVDGTAVEESKILLPTGDCGREYIVLTSIDLNDPTGTVDRKAVFSGAGEYYVSSDNIYIYEPEWQESSAAGNSTSRTTIRKIGYADGVFTAKAQNTIYGYLEDSFSIDEYEGYLRTVVTVDTSRGTSNAVYIMDKELKVVGKIEGLAEDERIYSARFMGDVGYFVTFRETDPLFSVDLSDPENPKIIGKLKIPGFSEYLHVYEEDLLLGIGQEVDEKTGVSQGVKLSMFDISDPSDVKEVDKYVIKGAYYADAFYDYKAVLIDADKDIIGFSVYHDNEMYYIFGYDEEEGFTCKMEKEVNGNTYGVLRSLYIEEKLYVVKGNIIEAYRISDFKKVDDIIF